jgi:rhodanese-related sulfurtransferase
VRSWSTSAVTTSGATANLQQLGLIHATDLDGGFTAWTAAGLPVIARADDDAE